MIRQGDIVLLPFPYTDLSLKEVRPALVVSSDRFNSQGEDVIFAYITTKTYNGPYDILIDVNDPGFSGTGLKHASTVRMGKVMCLRKQSIVRRLGHIGANTLVQTKSTLKALFGLAK